MCRFIISSVLLLMVSSSAFAQSGSLMGEPEYGTDGGQAMTIRNASFTYQPTPEPRLFKEHDFVTVLVNESSVYTNNNDLQRQRKLKGSVGLTKWVRWPAFIKLPTELQDDPPEIEGEIDHQTRAKGNLSKSEKIVFRITCRVAWKMDNGNLHIEGQQLQQIGEENKAIYFSGDIRPEDVLDNNTITSDKVADRVIKEIPSGSTFDAVKRSYGQRFVDRWFPF